MLDRPCELGTCREQLAKRSIDRRLACIATGYPSDGLSVTLDPGLYRPQHFAALRKRRRAPYFLRLLCSPDFVANRVGRITRYAGEYVPGRRVVTGDALILIDQGGVGRSHFATPSRLCFLGVYALDGAYAPRPRTHETGQCQRHHGP